MLSCMELCITNQALYGIANEQEVIAIYVNFQQFYIIMHIA